MNSFGNVNRTPRSQWHYSMDSHKMSSGEGMLQYRRPRWPDRQHVRGRASPSQVPLADYSQGKAPMLIGKVPLLTSCSLSASAYPLFARRSPSSGQWSPKHYNGCNKGQAVGIANNGMSFSGENSRHGASNCGAQLQAAVPFHFRLRNQIKWWEQHSSKEVLTLRKYAVTAAFPLPPLLSGKPCIRSQEESKLALEALEGIQVGPVKKIHPSQARHLIPWFVIKKGEIQTYNRLQRGKSLPATKPLKLKIGRKFFLSWGNGPGLQK